MKHLVFTLIASLVMGLAAISHAYTDAANRWNSVKWPKKEKYVSPQNQSGWKWKKKAEPMLTEVEVIETVTVEETVIVPAVAAAPVVVEEVQITFEEQFQFKTNSDEIISYSQTEIEKLAVIMYENPETKVRVEGHTDSYGASQYNQSLSQKRAQSVAKTLGSHGIAQDRVEAVGHGESKPIAPNNTAEGRQENRRVELYLIQE